MGNLVRSSDVFGLFGSYIDKGNEFTKRCGWELTEYVFIIINN